MDYSKLGLAIGITALVMLNGGATTTVFAADGNSDNLTPADIFKKAREKYASLTSYSDEGKSVSNLNGTAVTTAFTIKLARPDLYRVEWKGSTEGPLSTITTKTQVVWSAGEGNFLDMGRGAEKQENQDMALSGATGISGGAASTIPGTFFKINWGNRLFGPAAGEERKPDEKLGDTDCYVLTVESKDRTRTLWIGKQDLLIHQVRNVTSAEAMKAVLDEATKDHPEIRANLPKAAIQGVTSIETHTNIAINPKLSAADFGH